MTESSATKIRQVLLLMLREVGLLCCRPEPRSDPAPDPSCRIGKGGSAPTITKWLAAFLLSDVEIGKPECPLHMTKDSDRLYQILSSERFLSMQGLANEVPIFIHAYDVADEDRIIAMIKSMGSRLRNEGIQVVEVDLFGLLLAELRDEGLLDDFIEGETTFERKDLLGDLKNYAGPVRLYPSPGANDRKRPAQS